MSYLIHFNPNHDPKTGRFDFSLSGPKMSYYEGNTKRKYITDMSEKYQKEGMGKLKARHTAKSAAEMNEMHVRSYNGALKRNQKYSEKLSAAKSINDTKNIAKYDKKVRETYKHAQIDKILLSQSYELGKAFAKQKTSQGLFGIAGGIAELNSEGGYNSYYKNAKARVEKWMNSDPEFKKELYNLELESITDIKNKEF